MKYSTLSQHIVGRDNSFNMLRMAAALSVIFSHSYSLVGGENTPEPLSEFFPHYSLGRFSVWTFFIISGYFISLSFENRRSLKDFIVARALRIYPGLFISIALTALVLGPLVTELSLSAYFSHHDTYKYITSNLVLRWRTNMLPGVFEHNPYPNTINGSLWTLYYEVLCYMMVAAIGLVCLRIKRGFELFLLLYLPVHLWLSHKAGLNYAEFSTHQLMCYLHELMLPFVMGMCAYRYRNYIPFHAGIALLCAILIFALHGVPYYHDMFIMLWAYLLFFIGFSKSPLLIYNRLGDYSYGTYIYAFPIQQTLLLLHPQLTAMQLSLATIPFTLACAILSWHLIEERSLHLRRKWVK